jgi:hypothetical protein
MGHCLPSARLQRIMNEMSISAPSSPGQACSLSPIGLSIAARCVLSGQAWPRPSKARGVRLWPRISRLLLSEGQREAEGELAPLGVLAPQRCRRFSYPAHAVSSTRTRSSPAPSVTHLCPGPAPLRPGPAASACSACAPYVHTSRHTAARSSAAKMPSSSLSTGAAHTHTTSFDADWVQGRILCVGDRWKGVDRCPKFKESTQMPQVLRQGLAEPLQLLDSLPEPPAAQSRPDCLQV